jgi:hypothetical protein
MSAAETTQEATTTTSLPDTTPESTPDWGYAGDYCYHVSGGNYYYYY